MNHYEKPESFLLKIEYTKCLKKNLSLTYELKKTKHDSEKIPLRFKNRYLCWNLIMFKTNFMNEEL